MATIADLLNTTTTVGLHLVGGRGSNDPVTTVVVVESLESIPDASPGALVLLTPACTHEHASYEFDVAVRQAAAIGVSGLLFAEPTALSPTTTRLAERSGLALLGCGAGTSVAALVVTLDQLTRGDSGTLITRALAALEQVKRLTPRDDLAEILDRVSSHLGTDVAMSDAGEPVVVNGYVRYHLKTSHDDDATRLALPGIAAALSRWQAVMESERDAPEQARTEALSELLIREGAPITAQMMDRLRATGLLLDSTHLAFCISHAKAGVTVDEDLLDRRAQRERVRALASIHLPLHDGWSVAVVEEDVLLVHTETRSRDVGGRTSDPTLAMFITELRRDSPSALWYFGCGTAQPGLNGLQQSAKEARIAAGFSSNQGSPWSITTFDSTGVNRLLAEMGSSWASRRVIAELLAPIDELGPDRAHMSLETLNAYFDARGSLVAAGRLLHLHPNAVSYRIRRIKERTGWNLEDPELRFALHVAVRVRLMHQHPTG